MKKKSKWPTLEGRINSSKGVTELQMMEQLARDNILTKSGQKRLERLRKKKKF